MPAMNRGGTRATRRRCRQARSIAFAFRLIVVIRVPFELAHQIQQPLLLPSCDELLKGFGHSRLFVRSPLTSRARSIKSGSSERLVAMCKSPHISLHIEAWFWHRPFSPPHPEERPQVAASRRRGGPIVVRRTASLRSPVLRDASLLSMRAIDNGARFATESVSPAWDRG
jgi:hypothetical protein